LIHFKHQTGNREFRKTYDLSKGGNPLFYRYESTEPGAVLTIQITASFHEVGGVWIPESADYMRQDVSDRYDSHVTIWDDRVVKNQTSKILHGPVQSSGQQTCGR